MTCDCGVYASPFWQHCYICHTPLKHKKQVNVDGNPEYPDYAAMKARAGEDWQEITNDSKLFNAFKNSLDEEAIRAVGKVPESYKSIANCLQCGNVYLPAWHGLKLLSCLWCFNRVKGLSVPQATEE